MVLADTGEETLKKVTAPRFTIHVACFNRLELTRRCLRSVALFSSDYELIVTDNASTDGTKDFLRDFQAKLGDRMRVITNPKNLGFKDPCNHALTLARGEYLVLLNNDMVVCTDWLEQLQQPFESDPLMAITGIANTCGTIGKNLVGTKGKDLEYIEGSCLMVSTALARKHGLFSDYLRFAYWEDTDLSLRLRELGYHISTVNLPINHDARGSTTQHVPEARQALRDNTEAMKKRWGFYFHRRDLKRRILIRRLGAHGDVLLVTPALKAFREKYPQAEIQVVTKCPNMLTGVVNSASRGTKWYDEFYDLDLSYEKRPEVHIVQAYADVLGVKLPHFWQMEMRPTKAEEAWGERKSRGTKVALIHAGPTNWPGKNWTTDRFESVVSELRKEGYFTIAVGAANSPSVGCDETVAGQTTPQALYALAKHASLFIGIDSMPQHIASAADCPSVVLFGPTNPKCIVRPAHNIIAVQADVRLVPCVGEHGRRTKPITSVPCRGECMKAISPEMVLKAVNRLERIAQL